MLTCIIPCYRSKNTIASVVDEIVATVKKTDIEKYEIILVNDSSPDDTMEEIKRLCDENDFITGIELAKNFGQHAAIMAGLSIANGDVICCLDDDGQTPACEIPKLLDKINEGYDAVYARYVNHNTSTFRSFGTAMNKKMAESMLNKPRELEVTSFFCIKRFIAEEILKYENSYPYLIGLVLRTTKNICNVDVEHRDRLEGKSGYSFGKLLGLWINGFTSFSVKPLRLATYGGVLVAFIGFICTIWTVVHKILNPETPMGWSSTMAVLLIIGGAILFVLGMIGEYIGRIYISINNSPQYVIRSIYKKA